MNTLQVSENRYVLLVQAMTIATQLITTRQNSERFADLLEKLRVTAARYHDLQEPQSKEPAKTFEALDPTLQSALEFLSRQSEHRPGKNTIHHFQQLASLGLAKKLNHDSFIASIHGLNLFYSRKTHAKSPKSQPKP